jgi:ATP-dependent DNA ligase
MLPAPMLARAESTLPVADYAFEVKWTASARSSRPRTGFRGRSRRGWNMTPLIPELARDDVRGISTASSSRSVTASPHFPLVTARILLRRREIPVAFAVFDVLALDGTQCVLSEEPL